MSKFVKIVLALLAMAFLSELRPAQTGDSSDRNKWVWLPAQIQQKVP